MPIEVQPGSWAERGMRETLRRLASDWGAHVLLMVLTLTFGAMIALVFREQVAAQARLSASLRTTGWTLYQAGVEFYRFHNALDLYAIEPTQSRARNLKLRYEIFWSRLPILRESEEARFIERSVDIQAYINPIEAELSRLQEAINAVERIDRSELASIVETVGRMEAPIRDLMREVVAFSEAIYTAEREGLGSRVLWMLGGVFACGTAMVGLLVYATLRNRRLVRATESLAADVAARERSFRTLVESSPVGILIRPEPSGEIYANRALFAIFDVPLDRGEPDAGKVRAIMVTVCDGTAAPAGDGSRIVEWPRAGGRRGFAQVQKTSIGWRDGQAHLFTVTDVTENHEAQLKLAKASQLATLGELSTAVSHEINQPLTVIALAAKNARSALLSEAFETASLARKLERIERQVDRAKSITDHMRLFGRGGVDAPVLFDLLACVRSACRFVREQYTLAGIRLDLADIPDRLCQVVGHQIQLEQVLLNLLINARDAFAGKKREGGAQDGPVVRISIEEKGDRSWTVAVKDNAGGIGESIIERVFEPFFSTKPVGQGTGLGLSVAYGIVRDMGGVISVRNEDGGARFEIDLPRAEPECSESP